MWIEKRETETHGYKIPTSDIFFSTSQSYPPRRGGKPFIDGIEKSSGSEMDVTSKVFSFLL